MMGSNGCSHPNARLYQHGTQACCPDCKMRNNRISHYNDGNWMAVGKWFLPKPPIRQWKQNRKAVVA